jgi:transposase
MSKTSQRPAKERFKPRRAQCASIRPFSIQTLCIAMSLKPKDFAPNGYVGLDISKAAIDVCLLCDSGRLHTKTANSVEGIQKLCSWLDKHAGGPLLVALESTGRYGDLAAGLLHQAGHRVSVVNARWIKHYAKSLGRRNKTDRADAALIADYARTHDLDLWRPPEPEIAALRALLRRMKELEEMLRGEGNRREALPGQSPVHESLDRTTRMLEEEIARLKEAVRAHIQAHASLKADCERLQTIIGIGAGSAPWLAAELSCDFANSRAAAAWVGVTPRIEQSGSSVKGRPGVGFEGNRFLRAILYFPAVVARNKNPALRSFADRLAARGMSKKAVIVAVMHKLVRIAFALLKNQTQYDPLHVPAAFAALQNRPA